MCVRMRLYMRVCVCVCKAQCACDYRICACLRARGARCVGVRANLDASCLAYPFKGAGTPPLHMWEYVCKAFVCVATQHACTHIMCVCMCARCSSKNGNVSQYP